MSNGFLSRGSKKRARDSIPRCVSKKILSLMGLPALPLGRRTEILYLSHILAHLSGGQGVAGSNPAALSKALRLKKSFVLLRACFGSRMWGGHYFVHFGRASALHAEGRRRQFNSHSFNWVYSEKLNLCRDLLLLPSACSQIRMFTNGGTDGTRTRDPWRGRTVF